MVTVLSNKHSNLSIMSSDELYVKRCYLNKAGEVACEVRFEGREDVLPLERILNLTHMTALFADINAKAVQDGADVYQDRLKHSTGVLKWFYANQDELNAQEKKGK